MSSPATAGRRVVCAIVAALLLSQSVFAQIELPTIPIPTINNPFTSPTQAPAPLKPCTIDADCLSSGVTNAKCIQRLCVDPSTVNSATTAAPSSTTTPSTSTSSESVCALNSFQGCIDKIKTPVGYAVVAGIALLIILCFSCLFCCLCKVCCFAVKTTKAVAGAGLSITSSAAKGVARAAASGNDAASKRSGGKAYEERYTTNEERRRPPSDGTTQYHRERIYGDRAAASVAAGSAAAGGYTAASSAKGRDRYEDIELSERGYSDGPAPLPSNYSKPPQFPLEKKQRDQPPKQVVDIAGPEVSMVPTYSTPPIQPPAAPISPWGAQPQQSYGQLPQRAYDPHAPYGSNYNAPPKQGDPYAMAGYQQQGYQQQGYQQGYNEAGVYNQGYSQPPPNQGYGNQYGHGQYNNAPYAQTTQYPQQGAPQMSGAIPVGPGPQYGYSDQPYDVNGAPYGQENVVSDFNGSSYVNGSTTNYNNQNDMGSSFHGTPVPPPAQVDELAGKASEQGAGNVARWAEQQRMQLENGGFEDDEVASQADSQGVNPATMARRDATDLDSEGDAKALPERWTAQTENSSQLEIGSLGLDFSKRGNDGYDNVLDDYQSEKPSKIDTKEGDYSRNPEPAYRRRDEFGDEKNQGTLNGPRAVPPAMSTRSMSRENADKPPSSHRGNEGSQPEFPSSPRQRRDQPPAATPESDRYAARSPQYSQSSPMQSQPPVTAYRAGSESSSNVRPMPPQLQRAAPSDAYGQSQASPSSYEPPQDRYGRNQYDAPRSANPYSGSRDESQYRDNGPRSAGVRDEAWNRDNGPRSAGLRDESQYRDNGPRSAGPYSPEAGRYGPRDETYGDGDRRGRGVDGEDRQRMRSKSRAPPQATRNQDYRY